MASKSDRDQHSEPEDGKETHKDRKKNAKRRSGKTFEGRGTEKQG